VDAEILPWNLKAHSLIDTQYANVSEQSIMDRQHLLTNLKTLHALMQYTKITVGQQKI
jgi:hypothetical protein